MYIDLTEIPNGIATMFTTTEAVGGLLAVLGLLAITIVPLAVLTRGENAPLLLLTGILDVVLAVFLTWLDPWVLIVLVMGVAALYAILFGKGGG